MTTSVSSCIQADVKCLF